ncbi:hypothetical protein LY78DRAFT_327551 [Colletotrichum sublineola]|nr:hypothetical protein LY78DRAFT_327551 [Colletotrichum sublineola]
MSADIAMMASRSHSHGWLASILAPCAVKEPHPSLFPVQSPNLLLSPFDLRGSLRILSASAPPPRPDHLPQSDLSKARTSPREPGDDDACHHVGDPQASPTWRRVGLSRRSTSSPAMASSRHRSGQWTTVGSACLASGWPSSEARH